MHLYVDETICKIATKDGGYDLDFSNSNDYYVKFPIYLDDKSIYFGQWSKHTHQIQGEGMLIMSNGSLYQGGWHNNLPSGKGRLIDPEYTIYKGDF